MGRSESMCARQRAAPTRPGTKIAVATVMKSAPDKPRASARRVRFPPATSRAVLTRRRPTSRTARPLARPCGSAQEVLAAYWNEKREFEGFWLAIVKRIEPGELHARVVRHPGISGLQEPSAGHRRPPSRVPRLGQVVRETASSQSPWGGLRVAPFNSARCPTGARHPHPKLRRLKP